MTIATKKIIALPRSILSGSEDRKEGAWNVSRLAPPDKAEMNALMDLPRAWLEKRPWTPVDNCDPDKLWEYIDGHGMGGILGMLATVNLVHGGLQFESAQKRYYSNTLHYEQSLLICGQIAQAAKKEGIPVALLKGPAIVKQAYPDAGQRAYGDIDIFVQSRNDALRLVNALSSIDTFSEHQGFLKRIKNPGEVRTVIGGWILEISFPEIPYADPIQDYLNAEGNDVFRVHDDLDSLLNPNPSVHFTYLIMHMVINHFCSRTIWFLDLVALVRSREEDMDWNRITHDLGRVGLLNVAAHVSEYCRLHIDPNFPSMESDRKGWNDGFIRRLLQPTSVVNNRHCLQHAGFLPRVYAYASNTADFYLIGDSKKKRWLATRRSAARFLYGAGINNHFMISLTKVLSVLLVFTLACLVSFSTFVIQRHE